MSIQPVFDLIQETREQCASTFQRRAGLLKEADEVIEDQRIFAIAVQNPRANEQQIQGLRHKYNAGSDSELYEKIQSACIEKVRLIQAENTAAKELIPQADKLLASSFKNPRISKSRKGPQAISDLRDQIFCVKLSQDRLSEREIKLVEGLQQKQQEPAPMEGVVGAPLPPRIEALVHNIDEQWKAQVCELLSNLTPFALARIGNSLQSVDIPQLLRLGADYINAHQGELAYIPLETLMALDARVLEKLPHRVLREVGPRAFFSINPLVLNRLPVELLAHLDGQNLEQFALLDGADIEYFGKMTPEQLTTLGEHANLILRIPLTKLMRLTSNKEVLVVLDRISRSEHIPQEFWEDVHPDIWNKFSEKVCRALSPQFFDALYGIQKDSHQYRRQVVNNFTLSNMLPYLMYGVITSDGLKAKIDQMPIEDRQRADEESRRAEDTEKRRWATYEDSLFKLMQLYALTGGLDVAIFRGIYNYTMSTAIEAAAASVAKMAGGEALQKVAESVGHSAVMAECGPLIVLIGGVEFTVLNTLAIAHQAREWGPSEKAAAVVVAAGTGLLIFFIPPASLPLLGSMLGGGSWLAFAASCSVITSLMSGAVAWATVPLATIGRSVGSFLRPGEKEKVQNLQAREIDPRIQAGSERAAFLKTLTHLNAVSENLTEMARAGMLKPAIGREEEIATIIGTLTGGGERASVMLLGETGCGKTALVNGLAYRIARGDVPKELQNVEIFQVSLLRLQERTAHRGEFETKLSNILEETRRNYKNIILFVDEAHLLETAGAAENTRGMSEYLKVKLTGTPPLRLIGATTPSEYNQAFGEGDPFRRRFRDIQVQRPDIPKTVEMIKGYYRRHWENHDLVQIDDEAILAAVNLAQERLPDSAIKLLEELCNNMYASREGEEVRRITEELVREAADRRPHQAPAALPAAPEEEKRASLKRRGTPPPEGFGKEAVAEPPSGKRARTPSPKGGVQKTVALRQKATGRQLKKK